MTTAEPQAARNDDWLATRVVLAAETAAGLCERAGALVAEAAAIRGEVRLRRERAHVHAHVHVHVGKRLDLLERIAANDGLFRRANGELAFAGAAVGPRPTLPFLCECSDLGCGELVDVPLGAYVAHAAFPNRFLVTHRCALLSSAGEPTLIVEWEAGYAVVDRAQAFEVSEEPELQPRERHRAGNETVYRALGAQAERLPAGQRLSLFVCECRDERCRARLDLSVAEYEAVRSEPAWFVVEPGHARDGAETVVAGNLRYAVVEPVACGG